MKKTTILAVAAILCVFSSCKSQKEMITETEVKNEITNKYWKLVELNGVAVEGKAYITFKADSTINGSFGCNTFNGIYTQKPKINRIKFDKLTNTLMMCLDMSVENEFKRVLQIADSYNLTDKQLVLNRARMSPLARFEAVYME